MALRVRGCRSFVGRVSRRYDATSAVPGAAPAAVLQPESDTSRRSAAIDTALATVLGLVLVGGLGVGYHQWYKYNVLRQIEHSFAGGFDPILELDSSAQLSRSRGRVSNEAGEEEQIERPEQSLINSIVDGSTAGHYYLVLGQKGSGKSTLFINAMRAIQAEGCAWVEAHEDPEVFRLRLGKALLYEYDEDYVGGLFQRRGPREAGPSLDIERLLNKLEKVAIRYRKRHGRPAVIIINNCHILHDDEEGHALLHQMQQRAESWAAANALTLCILSDDYWPYAVLKKNASRMSVLTVSDLSEEDSVQVIAPHRQATFGETKEQAETVAKEIYRLVGGRLAYLSALSRTHDMVAAAHEMINREKAWLLSRTPLIVDHDDDVMDQQKFASCAFLLFQELARRAQNVEDLREVGIPLHETCQVMTRADFWQGLDHQNLISIDVNHMVRADSVLLLNVMRELVSEDDFQERLDAVRARIDEIESLHRTSELFVKDGHLSRLPIRLL